jgi:hypothetical protein
MAIQPNVQWIYPGTTGRFGQCVGISSDTIIVGEYLANNTGRAYVYRRQALNNWTLEQELIPSTVEAGGEFGKAVAIHGDTVFVGAPGQDNGGTNLGSVYVFTRSGTTWTETEEIVCPGANRAFGIAVACDSARLVAMDRDGTYATYGDVYVYTYSAGVCALEDSFTPLNESAGSIHYGESCSIDGDTIACTASKSVVDYRSYVYRLGVGSWALEQAILNPSAGTNVGLVVCVRGNTLVTGRPYVVYNAGTAYVHRRSGTTWTNVQTIKGSDVFRDNAYGDALAISDDERTIYVGAPGGQGSENKYVGGTIYRWDYDDSTASWIETWLDG